MEHLNTTQRRSLKAAIVFMIALIVACLLGAAPFFEDAFNEENLAKRHNIEKPKHQSATTQYVEGSLRHEVPTALEEVTVARIIDGDTIVVKNKNGEFHDIRLIGINAPESVSGDESCNTPEGYEATNHMKKILKINDKVYLQCDTEQKDEQGRNLRYVWLFPPLDFTDTSEIKTKMLNAHMLDDGYAVAHKFRPNDAYFDIFKAFQVDALHDKRGLWENGVDWAQTL